MSARTRLITLTAALGAALAANVLAAVPASAALPGLQKPVIASSLTDSSSTKTVTANCPTGKVLLGGTGRVLGGGNEVYLDGIKPTANSVTVEAAEDATFFAGRWQVQAIAICANPVPGLARVVAQVNNADSGPAEEATASCPAGKRLISTGADILGGGGKVAIEDITPDAGLTKVTVRAAEAGVGTTTPWTVRAIAVCASGLPGLELNTKATGADSASAKQQLVGCTSGKRVIGVAADVTTTGPVALTGADPVFSLNNATLSAVEPEPFDNPRWSLRGHTICATL
jgi:hypothetical protein